uniref:Ig-like domain-containing protein n=1 Tax=Labrus bergylta TaxID=56723 RepID=A0A3Q3G8M9_9LABR
MLSSIFCSILCGHASCPIELSPPSVVVRYGDPVSINCSTSETLFEGIGWEATEGAKPLQNVSHLTWTVDKLTDWSFSTSCYFNYHENSSSTQCLITPDVVLYSKFSFFSNSDEGVMKEMEEYNFTCHIPNIAPVQRLSVKWYKGDDFLHTETFNNNNKKPVNQTSILRFKATRQDSGVTFRCEAHMDLGQGELQLIVSSQDYNITVHYPPSQIVELEDSEVSVGSTVWLKCSSTGNPRPKYSWDYYRTDNVEVDSEDGVSRLIIHNATAFNMGLFTCHTWNDMGNVSKTARVTVKGNQSISKIKNIIPGKH